MAHSILAPLIAPEMAEVDRIIRARLASDVPLVNQVAAYIVDGGGKRLRPALLILSARGCAYTGTDHHLLAAVVEMIHTATLLHDDVVDESALRRGRATANSAFGNSAAVLVGDFLYSRAFQMMVTLGNMRVLEVLSSATNVIAEGEVLQLMNCGNPDVEEAQYLEVIRRKTAKLFEAAMRLGAILGGAPRGLEDALAEYGTSLGTAFQLVDDVLDYSGELEAIGKNLGDDLAEGKTTLPLIHAMRKGDPHQREVIRHAVTSGGLGDFAPVLDVLARTGALSYARAQAEAQAERARRCLTELPASTWKETLIRLADFAVHRSH